jgi:hypothetical protein
MPRDLYAPTAPPAMRRVRGALGAGDLDGDERRTIRHALQACDRHPHRGGPPAEPQLSSDSDARMTRVLYACITPSAMRRVSRV